MKAIKLLALIAALSMTGLLASCDSSTDPAPAISPKVEIYALDQSIEGKTYKEWAAEWWKQMDLTPKSQNILFDETGSRVLNGVSTVNSNLLFLGGVFNESGTATRTATIPSGKTLFFPVLNGQFDTVGTPMSVAERQDILDGAFDSAKDLSVTVDDSVIANVATYRVAGDLFSYVSIADNISDYPAGIQVSDVANDGYYLAIKPLAKGAHTIRIKGTIPGTPDFHLDVTYNLTVQ
jgi:hypothetical protein